MWLPFASYLALPLRHTAYFDRWQPLLHASEQLLRGRQRIDRQGHALVTAHLVFAEQHHPRAAPIVADRMQLGVQTALCAPDTPENMPFLKGWGPCDAPSDGSHRSSGGRAATLAGELGEDAVEHLKAGSSE